MKRIVIFKPNKARSVSGAFLLWLTQLLQGFCVSNLSPIKSLCLLQKQHFLLFTKNEQVQLFSPVSPIQPLLYPKKTVFRDESRSSTKFLWSGRLTFDKKPHRCNGGAPLLVIMLLELEPSQSQWFGQAEHGGSGVVHRFHILRNPGMLFKLLLQKK